MFVIDFDATPAKSFMHGFTKGLAAPVMLYHAETAPTIPSIEPVRVGGRKSQCALASDWARIGSDMRAVIDRHGKTFAG